MPRYPPSPSSSIRDRTRESPRGNIFCGRREITSQLTRGRRLNPMISNNMCRVFFILPIIGLHRIGCCSRLYQQWVIKLFSNIHLPSLMIHVQKGSMENLVFNCWMFPSKKTININSPYPTTPHHSNNQDVFTEFRLQHFIWPLQSPTDKKYHLMIPLHIIPSDN